jgi:hypothetical protein
MKERGELRLSRLAKRAKFFEGYSCSLTFCKKHLRGSSHKTVIVRSRKSDHSGNPIGYRPSFKAL